MEKLNEKYRKVYKEIKEKSESCFMLINDGKSTTQVVNGNAIELSNLFYRIFENDKDIFHIVKAATEAYKELLEFKKKKPDEQLDKLIDALKDLGEHLKKVIENE